MNGKKSKHIRRLLEAREPILLMTIRQHYGDRTKEMTQRQTYQAAKKLYKLGEIDDLIEATRGIRDMPTLRRG